MVVTGRAFNLNSLLSSKKIQGANSTTRTGEPTPQLVQGSRLHNPYRGADSTTRTGEPTPQPVQGISNCTGNIGSINKTLASLESRWTRQLCWNGTPFSIQPNDFCLAKLIKVLIELLKPTITCSAIADISTSASACIRTGRIDAELGARSWLLQAFIYISTCLTISSITCGTTATTAKRRQLMGVSIMT